MKTHKHVHACLYANAYKKRYINCSYIHMISEVFLNPQAYTMTWCNLRYILIQNRDVPIITSVVNKSSKLHQTYHNIIKHSCLLYLTVSPHEFLAETTVLNMNRSQRFC